MRATEWEWRLGGDLRQLIIDHLQVSRGKSKFEGRDYRNQICTFRLKIGFLSSCLRKGT